MEPKKRKASSPTHNPKKMIIDIKDKSPPIKKVDSVSKDANKKDEKVELKIKEEIATKDANKKEEKKDESPKYIIKSFILLKDDTLCPLASGDTFYNNRLKHYKEKSLLPSMINFTQLLNPQCKLGVFKSLKFTKCLFTTFVYGEELIFPIIKSGVPTHVIMHHESRFGKVAKHSDYSNCTFIFPKREMAYGVFHPKLMLLEFDTFLRVVISSANLSEVDWYLLSQVCWFQDFPLLTESETQDNCKFYKDLNEFITHIYNRMDPIIDIRKYNFTNASVSLVYSLNGRFKQFDDYGLGKICKLQAGSKLGKDAKVMFQTSSVGNINDKYLQCFYKCAQGVSPSSKDYPEVEAHFQMQFPTNEYIQNNRYGAESADCIIMPSKYYASKSFPQRILHQLTPIDGDDDYDHNLFHAKVMIISDDKGISDDTCLYIGSHNFSPSAWGKFEKDNSQLCMNNYELGVWFPAKEGSQEKKKQLLSRLMFKYPPLKYKPSDVPFQLDNINDE